MESCGSPGLALVAQCSKRAGNTRPAGEIGMRRVERRFPRTQANMQELEMRVQRIGRRQRRLEHHAVGRSSARPPTRG